MKSDEDVLKELTKEVDEKEEELEENYPKTSPSGSSLTSGISFFKTLWRYFIKAYTLFIIGIIIVMDLLKPYLKKIPPYTKIFFKWAWKWTKITSKSIWKWTKMISRFIWKWLRIGNKYLWIGIFAFGRGSWRMIKLLSFFIWIGIKYFFIGLGSLIRFTYEGLIDFFKLVIFETRILFRKTNVKTSAYREKRRREKKEKEKIKKELYKIRLQKKIEKEKLKQPKDPEHTKKRIKTKMERAGGFFGRIFNYFSLGYRSFRSGFSKSARNEHKKD